MLRKSGPVGQVSRNGLIGLRAGPLEVDLTPEIGGSIARFDWVRGQDRRPVMRPGLVDYADALHSSCFPLAPYSNRIRGGRFEFGGRVISLSPNMPGDRSPIHGQAWRAAWTLLEADERSARLAFDHDPDDWPWRYRVEQHVSLDEAGLDIVLSCRNLSDQAMPCGLGLHPYFHCQSDTELDADVTEVWTVDQDVLPLTRIAAEGQYNLSRRKICGQGLDNGFEGWSGQAVINWPSRGLTLAMTSADAPRFQVYSPAGGGRFAAEPVQNPHAARNQPADQWSVLGLKQLARDQQAQLHVRFTVTAVGGGDPIRAG